MFLQTYTCGGYIHQKVPGQAVNHPTRLQPIRQWQLMSRAKHTKSFEGHNVVRNAKLPVVLEILISSSYYFVSLTEIIMNKVIIMILLLLLLAR